MRIPCVVLKLKPGGDAIISMWVPIYYTRTYWGAKRIIKCVRKIDPNMQYQIREIWHA